MDGTFQQSHVELDEAKRIALRVANLRAVELALSKIHHNQILFLLPQR